VRREKKESISRDISNKTIMTILAVALIVTVMGTLVSVSKLSSLGTTQLLSGAATSSASGTSYINITSATSITNDISTIDFGQGYVNSSGTNCSMVSDGHVNDTGANCMGFSNVSSGFLIENTGNVNVSVNMTCSGNCTAAQFIGGTSPKFKFTVRPNSGRAINSEMGTLDSSASCNNLFGVASYAGLNNLWTDVTTTSIGLCGEDYAGNYTMDFTDSQDAFVVDINVSIPVDAPATSYGGAASSAVFTFSAVSGG